MEPENVCEGENAIPGVVIDEPDPMKSGDPEVFMEPNDILSEVASEVLPLKMEANFFPGELS